MNTKHSQPKPSGLGSNLSAGKSAASRSPTSKGPARRFRSHWVLLVGCAGLAAVVWLGITSFDHPVPTPNPPGQRTVTTPARSSAIPAPPRQGSTKSANSDNALREQLNRGNQLLAQGQPAEAAAAFTEALRLSPKDEDAHYNLGIALARQGKNDDAIRHYEEALRIFPDYVEAHNNLGNLLLRLRRADEAAKHFEEAVKIMPEYAPAWNNLGNALQQGGRTNEARQHFQKAVELNPSYWQAHYNLGNICLQQKRLDEARSEFQTVLRLQPEFQPAKHALGKIETPESTSAPAKP